MTRLLAAALLPLLAAPAMPALAIDETCSRWTVGMVEDEGGEVLTAQACASDRPEAWLSLTCWSGALLVRYDLAAGAETEPPLDDVTDVTFTTGTDAVTLSMAYQALDSRHAAGGRLDDPIIQLLRAGDTLTVSDIPAAYPVNHFTLKGSAAALGQLVADCS